MIFHHKQAEHVSVGVFKDHEGHPLVTVDGINLGTVDYIEDMIAKFRNQQDEVGGAREGQATPFVIENCVRIQSATIGPIEVYRSNLEPSR